ncbi:MAG: hypothetical protein H0A75_06365 [Candidatus Methanofishera endochildressiae]|uniref:Uncharacterized protein n=1 Tax=Candidatus Methanofishera endochildressiae TaxID=2738884 RepID=A0A7Z0MP58_9GAMM|nr:hypothetical protein [Candidatus Methanofishera endochildressiae]
MKKIEMKRLVFLGVKKGEKKTGLYLLKKRGAKAVKWHLIVYHDPLNQMEEDGIEKPFFEWGRVKIASGGGIKDEVNRTFYCPQNFDFE